MGIFKRFGPHYAIERFGVMFIALVLCMGVVVGSIVNNKIQYDHRSLSGNAIYTRSFVMSNSRAVGSVRGLYVDQAHTKMLMLLYFSDMSTLPTTAEHYSILMSGAKADGQYDTLQSSPSGMIYVFGSTGYMAIYMQDLNGFPSQLCQMYLQSDTNLSIGSGNSSTDRGLIYFNPGGSFATQAAFLERNDWTMFDMIEETVTRSQERAIRLALQEDLLNMAQQQVLIEEYTRRLENLQVVVPSIPELIDDTVYGVANDGSVTDRLHYITSYGGGWVDDAGKNGFRTNDVTLYLDAKYVVPGGFDFNWQDGRILTGYLESLSGTSTISSWSNYLADRASDKDTSRFSFDSDVEAMEWKLMDGSLVKFANGNVTLNQREKEIADTIGLLQTAWRSYYNLKVNYETTHLVSLLNLEVDARSSLDDYTVRTDGVISIA